MSAMRNLKHSSRLYPKQHLCRSRWISLALFAAVHCGALVASEVDDEDLPVFSSPHLLETSVKASATPLITPHSLHDINVSDALSADKTVVEVDSDSPQGETVRLPHLSLIHI